MAYNADLFTKAGLKLPDGSWNWQQYLETAQRLTVLAKVSTELAGISKAMGHWARYRRW